AVVLLLSFTPPGRHVLRAASARLRALGETPIAPESMTPDVSDSSWVRNRNLQHTVRLWRAHPLRGVGLGHFSAFASDDKKSGIRFRDPWCGWIASAAEMGIAGPI